MSYDIIHLDWIEPKPNESISEYSLRLSRLIDQKEDFILLGVSFGGIIASEINKIVNPLKTILVSSVDSSKDLRLIYKLFGKSGLINLIPEKLFIPPSILPRYLFGGAINYKLLYEILDEYKSKVCEMGY